MPPSPSKTRRKWCTWSSVLFVLACASLVNAQCPVIRLGGAARDYVAMLACIALLYASGIWLLVRSRWPWIVALVVVPCLAIGGGTALGSAFYLSATLSQGGLDDPSLEPMQTIPLEASRIVVYRTNAGAWARFGIDVRQELDLFPGVMLVRRLGYSSNRDEAEVTVTPGAVKIDYRYHGVSRFDDVVTIRRYVWF